MSGMLLLLLAAQVSYLPLICQISAQVSYIGSLPKTGSDLCVRACIELLASLHSTSCNCEFIFICITI